MNVLFISCHYPATSVLFCQRLAAAGATVLGIGDTPEAGIPAQLRDVLRVYRHVPDMNDREAMVAVSKELRDRFGTISRVESNIEFWLPTEAAVRAALGVPGLQPDELAYARSKLGMKRLFAEARVPLAAGMTTGDQERLREFAQFHGFPLFFKPDTGVGAAGSFQVNSMEELDEKLPTIPPNYLCEPFVRGRIVTFDGLADAASEAFFCTSHVYQPVTELIRQAGDTSVHSLREIPADLEAFGRASVKAFGIRERFFHIEFFETAPGVYQALEMNLRAPGGPLLHLMNYACDFDVFAAWARLVVHGDNKVSCRRKYHTAFVGRRRAIRYRHDHERLIHMLGASLLNHATLSPEERAALGDESYLIRHENLPELQEMIALIEARA